MLKRILGIVGWLGTALVLAAVAIRFLRPVWDTYAYWLAWGGLVCVLLYTLGQWREIAHFFARRQARLSVVAAAGILIVLGILVAINYIASRENKRWDLTATAQYTLADQTRKVLQSLDAPLKVFVFEQEPRMPRFRDRMSEYGYISKQVIVEYVDPDKKPTLARQYQVQQYGTVVLEYKGRTERVVSDAEQELTNGIIKVVTGRERKVYFAQGHGEKDTASSERTGFTSAVTALTRDNFKVESVVLAQQREVPADASLVVVAGPKTDYLPTEIDALRAYLQRGGKCLFMLDPPERADSPPLTNLLALAREWGIEVGSNVVVDVSGIGTIFGTDEYVPVAAAYPPHAITDRFKLLTAYPLARAVTPIPGGAGGRTAQAIVETSPKSWAETDLKTMLAGGRIAMDAAKGDTQGPVPVGAAVSAPAPEAPAAQDQNKDAAKGDTPRPESRVVVIGDSDFAANFILGFQGNRDFFMNVVNWLAQQENLIAIRPREPDDRRVTLTAEQQWQILLLS
ncbi:MAG: GldG family protein, partial [Acidobacteria bacterium]|nr:GldG family protein [Acidobacteriota bacterium]